MGIILSAFGLSNDNKWQMVDAAVSSFFWHNHSPSWFTWSGVGGHLSFSLHIAIIWYKLYDITVLIPLHYTI